MKTAAAVICAMLVSACVKSTGILPSGPDTYLLTDSVGGFGGGWRAAQPLVLNEANAFCTQQGKLFVPVEMGTANQISDYTVTFRCLPSGHPDVEGFPLRRAPAYIIEERNR